MQEMTRIDGMSVTKEGLSNQPPWISIGLIRQRSNLCEYLECGDRTQVIAFTVANSKLEKLELTGRNGWE